MHVRGQGGGKESGGQLRRREFEVNADFEPLGKLDKAASSEGEPVPELPVLPPILQQNPGEFREHELSTPKGSRKKRMLIVYLPPGYSADDPWRYPVVYVQDGQNIFDPATSAFGVDWGLDRVLQTGILEGKIRPLILAAVYNSRGRLDEYTPTSDPTHRGGKADEYMQFLLEEVKPLVDSQYHTSSVREETCMLGSSLGGLVALYAGWRYNKIFGVVGALSPSLWWAGRDLITGMGGDPDFRGPERLWIDMGTRESNDDRNRNGVPDVLDDLRTLRAVLLYRGYIEGRNLFYEEVEGAAHTESDWGKRAGRVLAALFPPVVREDTAL